MPFLSEAACNFQFSLSLSLSGTSGKICFGNRVLSDTISVSCTSSRKEAFGNNTSHKGDPAKFATCLTANKHMAEIRLFQGDEHGGENWIIFEFTYIHFTHVKLWDLFIVCMIRKKSTHCYLWRDKPGAGCRSVNLRASFLYVGIVYQLFMIYKVPKICDIILNCTLWRGGN